MSTSKLSRHKKLLPVAAALAFAGAEVIPAIAARGLRTEVSVAAKRTVQGQDGTAYLMSFAEAAGEVHEDLPVSETAWHAFQVGDRLPARRSLGGRLYTIDMRYSQ